MQMSTGDVICSCCGSYYRCNCRRQQSTLVSVDEKRMVNLLENIVELLKKLLEETEAIEKEGVE